MLNCTNFEEINKLGKVSEFYERGDDFDNLIIEREAELLKKYCNNKINAIEIGCGSGYSTSIFLKIFNKYDVVEPVDKNIELLKNRLGANLEKIGVYNCLFEDLDITAKYKNIILFNILEHVEYPIEMLKKAKSLLEDDGEIFISVPNCMSLNRRAGYKMGMLESYEKFAPKDIEVGHRRLYYPELLKEHIAEAGLKIKEMKGIFLKPLSEAQMKDLGMDVVKAFYTLGEDIPEYCSTIFTVLEKKYF